MEWTGFYESNPDQSLMDMISTEFQVDRIEWSFEENKLFENALAEFDPASPGFYENVAARIPWKSIEEIKQHYKALVEDIEMIESGRFPIPSYENNVVDEGGNSLKQTQNEKGSSSSSQTKRISSSQQIRQRGVPWTEEEHQLFLMGLNKYGKGDWRSISRYYVVSKSPTQVASHAQKYFRRQNSSTPLDRRRPSIHDIQTVNPSSISQNQLKVNNETIIPIIPMSNFYGLQAPMFNQYHNSGLSNFSSGTQVAQPIFPPVATTLPMANPMLNQTSDAYPSANLQLPSMMNWQWG